MLDDFLHSPLAQGMAGGLALVVLFVALKLAVKAVKAAFTLLVLGALVLLAAAAVWAWRDGGGAARARATAAYLAAYVQEAAAQAWARLAPYVRGR